MTITSSELITDPLITDYFRGHSNAPSSTSTSTNAALTRRTHHAGATMYTARFAASQPVNPPTFLAGRMG